jgi:hypothetical protein
MMKRRASVHRSVSRLLDELVPERPPAKYDEPTTEFRRHRAPGRCILQGSDRAVSVSWFPGTPADDSLGELVVILWRGTVSLPGSLPARGAAAQPLETMNFRPYAASPGEWHWQSDGARKRYAVEALASHCLSLLEG